MMYRYSSVTREKFIAKQAYYGEAGVAFVG